MNAPKRPILSVVDYEAWERGYMPPSEHVLIDQLAHRGARVITMSDWGDYGFWIVMRGKPTCNAERKYIRDIVALAFKDEDEPTKEGDPI